MKDLKVFILNDSNNEKELNSIKELLKVYGVTCDYDLDLVKEWLTFGDGITLLSYEKALEFVKNDIESETAIYYNHYALIDCLKSDFTNIDREDITALIESIKQTGNNDTMLALIDSEDLAAYHIMNDGVGQALNRYDGNHIELYINGIDYYIIEGDFSYWSDKQ